MLGNLEEHALRLCTEERGPGETDEVLQEEAPDTETVRIDQKPEVTSSREERALPVLEGTLPVAGNHVAAEADGELGVDRPEGQTGK